MSNTYSTILVILYAERFILENILQISLDFTEMKFTK